MCRLDVGTVHEEAPNVLDADVPRLTNVGDNYDRVLFFLVNGCQLRFALSLGIS